MLSEAIFSHLLDVCYRGGVLNELSFSIMQFYYQSIPQCNVVTFLNKKISLSESCKIAKPQNFNQSSLLKTCKITSQTVI